MREQEEENEELKYKLREEIKEQQAKSEQQLAQLKNLYEVERETLESRIQEEREKCQKKLQLASEEYFEQKRQEQAQYEEEIEGLKEDLREQEQSYHGLVGQYEHELALKQQTIETLEKYIKETKESLAQLQMQNNTSLEQHLANFTLERKQLMEKLDSLSVDFQKKEKDNVTLAQKKEYLEATLERRDTQIV